MADNFTPDELERRYIIASRNADAYRQALEKIIAYCGDLATKVREPTYMRNFLHIQAIANSAMTSTGEHPRDGLRR